MKYAKNKYRTTLTDEHLVQQLRVVFSDAKPDIERIVQGKQHQVFHWWLLTIPLCVRTLSTDTPSLNV